MLTFCQQYRFAASESVQTSNIPKAISLILLLGIVASLLGANIVSLSKDILNSTYVGSYIAMSLLTIIPFFFFVFYQNEKRTEEVYIKSQKSIIELLSNKDIQLSILSAGVGYATMSTLMTATPIHMNMMHGFSIFSTGIVLQMHVIGMFLPSLITGDLIKKFGHKNIRANSIAPGLIRTDFAKALWENPDILESVLSTTPMRRIGEPDEISGVAVMLASDAGNYINGQTIVVDGGTTIS